MPKAPPRRPCISSSPCTSRSAEAPAACKARRASGRQDEAMFGGRRRPATETIEPSSGRRAASAGTAPRGSRSRFCAAEGGACSRRDATTRSITSLPMAASPHAGARPSGRATKSRRAGTRTPCGRLRGGPIKTPVAWTVSPEAESARAQPVSPSVLTAPRTAPHPAHSSMTTAARVGRRRPAPPGGSPRGRRSILAGRRESLRESVGRTLRTAGSAKTHARRRPASNRTATGGVRPVRTEPMRPASMDAEAHRARPTRRRSQERRNPFRGRPAGEGAPWSPAPLPVSHPTRRPR
jgi:hypothetical protein